MAEVGAELPLPLAVPEMAQVEVSVLADADLGSSSSEQSDPSDLSSPSDLLDLLGPPSSQETTDVQLLEALVAPPERPKEAAFELDPLDAEWEELLAEQTPLPALPLPALPLPLAPQPPPTAADVSSAYLLEPVVDSDDEEEEEALTQGTNAGAAPLTPAPPTEPLRLTCSATSVIDDGPSAATPSDGTLPSVPLLVAAIEAWEPPVPGVLPERPEPPPAPAVPPTSVAKLRRRGGPPEAVLMERMALGDSIAIVS